MPEPSATYFDKSNDKSKSGAGKEIVFFVEGIDDAFFMDRLLRETKVSPARVGIVYLEGRDNLERNLRIFLRTRPVAQGDVRRYALVLDADDDPEKTVSRVHASLSKHNQPTPSHGALAGGSPEVGLFVIPSASEDGNLEKLLMSTISTDQKFIFVDKFFRDIQNAFHKLDEPYKRLSRIYLDCCHGHFRGAGRAFHAGSFNGDHYALGALRAFVATVIAP